MADEPQGPVMLAMTSALKPPPTRISRIGNDITLPVALQVSHIVAALIGAFTGMLVAVVVWGVLFRVTFTVVGLGLLGGAFAGVITVTWSPIKGESMLQWLGLTFKSNRGNQVEIDGEKVKAYIGTARLPWTSAGRTRIFPGAMSVPVGSVDERGVLIPHDELRRRELGQNLPTRLRLPGVEDGFDPVRPGLDGGTIELPPRRGTRWGRADDPAAHLRRP